MVKKTFITLCLVTLLVVFGVPIVAYAINPPTNYSIVKANGYKDLGTEGDILIVGEFDIDYGTSPPTDYTASQAWVVRLLDGSTELARSALFTNPYYQDGVGEGCVGLYISAEDVVDLGVVYGSTNYTLSLERNPAISWNGTAPTPKTLSILWTANTTDQQEALKNRVLALATQFRADWGLTDNLAESGVLTTDGENYFTGAIPNLRELCPDVFSSYFVAPTFYKKTFSLTYALTLRNQWIGTWLDLTTAAADWSIDPIWLYGIPWTIVIFAACWGVAAISNSNKGIYWVATMGIGVGSFIGFYPWSALGIAAVVAVLIIANEIGFKRTSA